MPNPKGSVKYIESRKRASKKYKKSTKGRARINATKKVWTATEKGQESIKASGKVWRRTAAYKATVAPKMQARRARRLAWLRDIKAKLSCSECGFEHPAALHFHHTGDDKTGGITELLLTGNVNLEVVKAEMAKCIVLCANCHAILHDEKHESVRALRTRGRLQIQGEDGHSLNQIILAGKRQGYSNSGATNGEQFADDLANHPRGNSPLC